MNKKTSYVPPHTRAGKRVRGYWRTPDGRAPSVTDMILAYSPSSEEYGPTIEELDALLAERGPEAPPRKNASRKPAYLPKDDVVYQDKLRRKRLGNWLATLSAADRHLEVAFARTVGHWRIPVDFPDPASLQDGAQAIDKRAVYGTVIPLQGEEASHNELNEAYFEKAASRQRVEEAVTELEKTLENMRRLLQ